MWSVKVEYIGDLRIIYCAQTENIKIMSYISFLAAAALFMGKFWITLEPLLPYA